MHAHPSSPHVAPPAASSPPAANQHDATEFQRLEDEYQSRTRPSRIMAEDRNGRPAHLEERTVVASHSRTVVAAVTPPDHDPVATQLRQCQAELDARCAELRSTKQTLDGVCSQLESHRSSAIRMETQLQESQSELVQRRTEMQSLQQQIANRDMERAAHLGQLQGIVARDAILELQLQAAQAVIHVNQEQDREHAAMREERDRAVASQTASSHRIAMLQFDLLASQQTHGRLCAELMQTTARAAFAENGRDSLQLEVSSLTASHTAEMTTTAVTHAESLKRKAEDDAAEQKRRHEDRVREHEAAAREADLERRLQSAQTELRTREAAMQAMAQTITSMHAQLHGGMTGSTRS